MTRPPELWDGIVRRLAQHVPPHEIDAWLRPLRATQDAGGVRLLCPTAFHRDRVRSRYLEPIRAAAAREVGAAEPPRLHLEVGVTRAPEGLDVPGDEASAANAVAESTTPGANGVARATTPGTSQVAREAAPDADGPAGADALGAGGPRPAAVPDRVPMLPPRHAVRASAPPRLRRAVQQSFETFEVGPSNALAREAAFALASATQREVNPLFLAADSGQGKTHLGRSIAALARRESAHVVYRSAEGFTSEFLGALRSRAVPAFKRRYREECDVLVLEDVEFLPGKESTQLELFHTVAHLLDAGARVVFTGARLPRAIRDLDRRLGAQMASGLVAEIAPPDAGLRRRILASRAAAGGVRLPDDCLERLVEAVRGSVRDLESVLGQVVASAALLKRPIDRELVEVALRKLGGDAGPAESARPVAPREVIEMVAAFFGTTPEALASRSRRRDALVPRQLAMYLCRRFTDASFSEIGRELGRDHPSVRNAVASMERRILERAPLRYQVEALSDRLAHLRSGR